MGDLQTSTDRQKRLEYTARQKALYDYNTLMEENYERGYLTGEERGIQKGIQKGMNQIVEKMRRRGMSYEQIREILNA